MHSNDNLPNKRAQNGLMHFCIIFSSTLPFYQPKSNNLIHYYYQKETQKDIVSEIFLEFEQSDDEYIDKLRQLLPSVYSNELEETDQDSDESEELTDQDGQAVNKLERKMEKLHVDDEPMTSKPK